MVKLQVVKVEELDVCGFVKSSHVCGLLDTPCEETQRKSGLDPSFGRHLTADKSFFSIKLKSVYQPRKHLLQVGPADYTGIIMSIIGA